MNLMSVLISSLSYINQDDSPGLGSSFIILWFVTKY